MKLFNEGQYILSPDVGPKSRFKCPYCGRTTFVPYIDSKTGCRVGVRVGYCCRTECHSHNRPDMFFQCRQTYLGGYNKITVNPESKQPKSQRVVCRLISPCLVDLSKNQYEQNNFILWLRDCFDDNIVHDLIERFQIGTARYWPNATVFWQIDREGYVRTGRVMLYDSGNGKLLDVELAHNILERVYEEWEQGMEYNLDQCLFGEHQLLFEHHSKPVAIVALEKTAILASVYNPNYIWMAVGTVENLCPQKLQSLTGRKVILFPDLGAYDHWAARQQEIERGVNFQLYISDILEVKASDEDRQNRLDISDYLARTQLVTHL